MVTGCERLEMRLARRALTPASWRLRRVSLGCLLLALLDVGDCETDEASTTIIAPPTITVTPSSAPASPTPAPQQQQQKDADSKWLPFNCLKQYI
jgi:hypothetical protein